MQIPTFLPISFGSFPVVYVLVLASVFPGCRSLRNGQRDLGVSEARQFSLRGTDALQLKKYDDAEALFSEALRRCPADERAHWGMAEVQAQKGNCQTATVHMQEASRLSGNNPDLLVRLGEMHLESKRLDQALAQAESALTSNRQHAGAWQLRGNIHREQQQWQEAIDCYQRSLMSRPNNPSVQMALAGIYLQLGRPQRALATLERMSDLQSSEYQSAQAFLLKGQALASLDQVDDAKLCLREAASRASAEDYGLFLQLAYLQAEVGQIAEARLSLGRTLVLQPENSDAIGLQRRLDQQFASLVSAGDQSPSNAMIDTIPRIAMDSDHSMGLGHRGLIPARPSVYGKKRD